MEKTEHICKYCHKPFRKESTLAVHMCEKKRRWNSKNDKAVILGMQTFIKFYKYSTDSSKEKTYEDFVESPYYSAFVKFGNYCLKTRCVKMEHFIDWVIRSGIKLDKWGTDATYSTYLDDILKKESVLDAIERAMEYSLEWGEEKNMRPEDILRYGSTNRICYAIFTGKLSPWVIYQSESGQEFLGKLNSEQSEMIWHTIDPDFWGKTFMKRMDDADIAKEVLHEAGW